MADVLVVQAISGHGDYYNVTPDTELFGTKWLSASESFSVTSVKLWLDTWNYPASGNCWIEIYNDSSGNVGTKIGQSDNLALSTIVAAPGAECTFVFSTPVALTASNPYYFMVNRGASDGGVEVHYYNPGDSGWKGWKGGPGTWAEHMFETAYIKVYKTEGGGTPINIALAVGGS